MIRPAQPRDAAQIAAIYNHYIRETVATFEVDPIDEDESARRIENVSRDYPWLVLEEDGRVVGYAYAGRWHARRAFQHTAEVTVYLANGSEGGGRGRQLYEALLAALERLPIHTVMGVIALPNAASVGLHEKLGFEKVGHHVEVGRKFGRWIDVGYWQKTIGGAIPEDG